MPRYLAQFSAVLFDMNGTFMFGHDRFGPDVDYFETYRALGGSRLDREALQATMTRCLDGLLAAYNDPDRFDDFPPLSEAFVQFGCAPAGDVPLLERVFAIHEIGHVPGAHHAFLRTLAATHWLGVVSNICARPELWLTRSDDMFSLFQCRVFSSEGRSIKPSPALFRRALDRLPAGARTVFVGDSLERDIVPAKALGLATVWIAPPGS